MKQKIFIYQVLPRLFGNTKNLNKENGSIEENGVGKFSSFSKKALREIQKMGFSHIWYTGILEHASKTDYSGCGIAKDNEGIVKGNAGSPYAIRDYYDVDPDLADNVLERMSEFEQLIERTHNAGLKMIIDFVPNHVARQYHSDAKPRHIRDLGADDDVQLAFYPDNNFYYIPDQKLELQFPTRRGESEYQEIPAKATGNDCFSSRPSINDWYETIKLNYGIDYQHGGERCFLPIPNTWEKMRDILLFWTAKGVDGFRCDMAEMVPVEFWNWVIPQVKRKNKQIIFIAEVYDPTQYQNYVHWGLFDYLYDKVDLYDTLRDVVCGHRPSSDITFSWQRIDGLQDKMLNFLENHDEQRIASDFFAANPFKAIPAMIVTAAMNTNPVMIYFGQELGEPGMNKEGFSGCDGRTTIFDYWSPDSIRNWYNEGNFGTKLLTKEQKKLRKFYIQLLQICNNENTIARGKFYDLMYANYENLLFDSTKQYVFLRSINKEFILVVANFSDQKVNININIPSEAFDYMEIQPSKIKRALEMFSGEQIVVPGDWPRGLELQLDGYSGKIIKFS